MTANLPDSARSRLGSLLSREDGEAALLAAESCEPDVVLLDVGLPDISGIEVARRPHERSPELAVVVVSTHDRADYGELALASGARGFLSKLDLTGEALGWELGAAWEPTVSDPRELRCASLWERDAAGGEFRR